MGHAYQPRMEEGIFAQRQKEGGRHDMTSASRASVQVGRKQPRIQRQESEIRKGGQREGLRLNSVQEGKT